MSTSSVQMCLRRLQALWRQAELVGSSGAAADHGSAASVFCAGAIVVR
jgi:hypothetical protein